MFFSHVALFWLLSFLLPEEIFTQISFILSSLLFFYLSCVDFKFCRKDVPVHMLVSVSEGSVFLLDKDIILSVDFYDCN